jgi:hypothetical protein
MSDFASRPTATVEAIGWIFIAGILLTVPAYGATGPRPVEFTPPVSYPVPLINAPRVDLNVLDLNADSNVDVIAVAGDTLAFFYGDGTGVLTNGQSIIDGGCIHGCHQFTSVAACDLNHDGCLDLAALDWGDTLRFYKTTDCLYASTNVVSVPPGSLLVVGGDFNKDGSTDFAIANPTDYAIANPYGSSISVLLGDGQGGALGAVVTCHVAGSPYAVAAGDLDGDGNIDLVSANIYGKSIAILYGRGDGTFEPATYKKVVKDPRYVALGDLNGDGKLDIAVASFDGEGVTTLVQTTPRHFRVRKIFKHHASIYVALGDVNGDGLADILTANYYEGSIGILAGTGSGKFTYLTSLAVGAAPYAVRVGDLDGDGKLDIISGNFDPNATVSVLLNHTGK